MRLDFIPFRASLQRSDSTRALDEHAGQLRSTEWPLWQELVLLNAEKWWDAWSKGESKFPELKLKNIIVELLEEFLSVKAKLTSMIQGQTQCCSGSTLLLNHEALIQRESRTVGMNQVQLFARHESGNSIVKAFSETGADVRALCKEGRLKEALHILDLLEKRGPKVRSDTYVCLLQGCTKMKALGEGKQIHAHISRWGFKLDILLGNSLINMYTMCRSVVDAHKVFDKMLERNVFTWTMLISGYAKQGNLEEAFKLFCGMVSDDVKADKVSFLSILSTCTSPTALEKGKRIHSYINKSEYKADLFLGNSLIGMYARCGSIEHAHQVFDQMPRRNVVSWTLMIAAFTQQGKSEEAVCFFWQMEQSGVKPDKIIFPIVLKACASLGSLEQAKQIHAEVIRSGFESDIYVGNSLIDMFAKCGSIEDACQVFDKMPKRDVVSWTVMIAAYTQHGHTDKALSLFWHMQQEGVKPNKVTLLKTLTACVSAAALEQGKRVHAHIIKNGFELDVTLWNSLVDMYAKCGSIEHAREVFDKMPERDVVSWNSMITGYTQHGLGKEAILLFRQMLYETVKPNEVTFLRVLKACGSIGSLEYGKKIHIDIIKCEYESHAFIASSLVDMYAKCGSIEHARLVFDKMPEHDVISWTAMIAGYAQHELGEEALKLFWRMKEEGVKANNVTFVSILNACVTTATLEQGRQIHAYIIESGFESDPFVGSTLVNMYIKCGSIHDASDVFEKLPKEDVVIWNTMIVGYSQYGHNEDALKLFWQMQQEGINPNEFTFVSAIKACAALADLEQGKQIHAHITGSRFEANVFVGNSLIDMYAKSGSIGHARQVFDKIQSRDVVTWTVMIAGCVQHEHAEEAFKLFWQMQQEGLKPDNVTFITILKLCANLGALEQGKRIHAKIIEGGFELNLFVGNCLIDMYAKCGSLQDAHYVFNKMHKRDVVSWTIMIAGYSQNGENNEIFKLFWQMQHEGVKADKVTFVNILNACASLAALEQGKQIHTLIIKSGLDSDVFVGNALVDMYAKCGNLESARKVFDNIPKKDVVSWTTMIAGYAQHGDGKEALQLVTQMQEQGVKLQDITFIAVLSACSHTGLVDEGCHYFNSMYQHHDIIPSTEHYACMVDLLGRAGCLEEAEDFITIMPFQPSGVVWRALLGACRVHGNITQAELTAKCILELEPQNTAAFVLLSNIYAAAGTSKGGKYDEREMSQDVALLK